MPRPLVISPATVRPCSNMEKMRGMASGSMPMPLSSMTTCNWPCAWRAVMWMWPPSGVNFTAFETMLAKICTTLA